MALLLDEKNCFLKRKQFFYNSNLQQMDYSKESQDRMKKIQALKDAGVIVYANNLKWKIDIAEIRKRSEDDTKGGYIRDIENLMVWGSIAEFKTAGRIMATKSHGKLTFAKLRDHSWDIQVFFMRDLVKLNTGTEIVESIEIDGEEKSAYKIAEKFCQVGDYIAVQWDLFETKHGELTIFVSEFQIMSKAVRPLPEKWHWVQDIETIYRQRYLDMIMNTESFERFKLRSTFVKTLRDFYESQAFIEIETPVLWNSASWAAAAPFTTHHNDFNEEFFLRISPETALKKATVWRFERVVEFTRNFRNEWSDPSHIQEFSAIEHYAAWWNYEDNMKFTEDMFDFVFQNIPELKKEVLVKDKSWAEKQVNFATPWPRIDYIAWVLDKSGIDVSQYWPEDEDRLRTEIKKSGYSWEWIDKQVTATMIDYLYKKVLRPGITGPAFVYNYPKSMQPLARGNDTNPDIVEQWQLVINGWEVIKAYSELVDPKIQIANFEAQGDALAKWDLEATSSDDDFVLAMEYGMPPQSGWWMGVERILALLTGQDNLRDMVLFPLMKTNTNEEKPSKKTQLAVALLNKESKLQNWQELNTIAHLSASFSARVWKSLFEKESAITSDGQSIPMNIQHAIIIKQAENNQKIQELYKIAKNGWLEVVPFTREMLETSDDSIVQKNTEIKKMSEVEYLGILIFGDKKHVEKLTKEYPLYS